MATLSRGIYLALLIIISAGCQSILKPGQTSLTYADASAAFRFNQQTQVAERLDHIPRKPHADQYYYLVKVDRLLQEVYNGNEEIEYLGSSKGFHFFRMWAKITEATEINTFVLPIGDCQIISLSATQNQTTYKPVAAADLNTLLKIDGRCVVYTK